MHYLNDRRANAPDYDLFAHKRLCETVNVSVQSSRTPNFDRHAFIVTIGKGGPTFGPVGERDYTVLVMVGETNDRFYVVPTRVFQGVVNAYWQWYFGAPTLNGKRKVENGRAALHFHAVRNGEVRPGYGLDKEWASYRDGWEALAGG